MIVSESRMLIGLDELFDTRQGTLTLMDQDKSLSILHDPGYSNRIWDFFPGVDRGVFSDMYSRRDKKTLRVSSGTRVLAIVSDFLKRCGKSSMGAPKAFEPKVDINVYPYKLTDSDKVGIEGGLRVLMPLLPEIRFVDYSLDQLNPVIAERYGVIVMYEGFVWLNIHSENGTLTEFPIPEVTMFCPIRLDKEPSDLHMLKDYRNKFNDLAMAAQPIVNLEFLGLDTFSSVLSNPGTDTQDSGSSLGRLGEASFS